MKPKKKSSLSLIIVLCLLLIIAFFAIKIGIAFDDVETLGGIDNNGKVDIKMLMERISIRLSEDSLKFTLTDNVKKSLLIGVFVWLIIVAYHYSSKKNYIHGKTFGTATWGTLQDISDLFAANIANKEIKQAKRVKTAWGRYSEHKKILKSCRKYKRQFLTYELQKIEEWKKGALADIEDKKTKNSILKEYEAKKNEAEKKAEAYFESSYNEAWYPAKLKSEYEKEVDSLTKLEAEESEFKEAKARYEKKLNDFFKGDKKIEKIKKKYENADSLLTKTERISIYNYVLNNNTLIIGGSGSGKTRGFVMPNVLQAHSSYVITDPKGEILEKSGYFLEHIKGYKIRVLNLDDKSSSDGYNPFKYIHPEREGYEERVLSLIEAIILNTDGGEKKNGSDPFWDKAERLFLQAVFFFTCIGFDEEQRNINTVLKLISMLEIGEEEDKKDSQLDHFVNVFASDHGENNIGVQQYREFRGKATGKTAKSIVISTVARLAPFRTSEVKRIFSYDSMDLEIVGEEKTAIFVVVPPTDTTFNFIAGMLFTQLFQELQYCATQKHKHEGQRLPVPVRFILDEFANTCQIPQFVKILAYARSFGIGITPILQSLEQIKKMYEKEWGVIIDNCNTLLFLGSVTHNETLEYMSKLIGKGTFDKRTTGITKGKTGSSSQNFDEVGRELMDVSEIRKLPKKDCLLVVGGRNPFYSEKYEYTSHPNYIYTSDSNSNFSYEYIPQTPQNIAEVLKKARKRGEEEMEKIIQKESEKIESELEENKYEINISEENVLNKLTNKTENLVPISSDLLTVDDGTETLDYDMFLDSLLDEEESQIDNFVENIQYSINSDQKEIAQKIIESGENLVPISNDILNVDEGEGGVIGAILDDDLDDFIDESENNFGSLSGDITELENIFNDTKLEL